MTRFAPQWLQAGSYAASVDRRLIGALWPGPASAGGAVQAAGGMAVQAAPGQVAVPAGNNTGSVLCSWDANETVTLDAAPAAGLNRIDLVVVQARSADIGGATGDDFIITFTKGTEAAAPVAPAVPANAVALAQIAVNGGVAAIVAANITDRRPANLSVRPPVYFCRYGRVAAFTWTTAASAIGHDTVQTDPAGLYNPNTGIATLPVAGRWRMRHQLSAGGAAGAWLQAQISTPALAPYSISILSAPAAGAAWSVATEYEAVVPAGTQWMTAMAASAALGGWAGPTLNNMTLEYKGTG